MNGNLPTNLLSPIVSTNTTKNPPIPPLIPAPDPAPPPPLPPPPPIPPSPPICPLLVPPPFPQTAPPTYNTLPHHPLQYVQPATPYQQQISQPYLYLPTYNTSKSSFSTTTHIPELKSQADWGAWNLGVLNVLTSQQLNTHICDPPSPLVNHDVVNTLS